MSWWDDEPFSDGEYRFLCEAKADFANRWIPIPHRHVLPRSGEYGVELLRLHAECVRCSPLVRRESARLLAELQSGRTLHP